MGDRVATQAERQYHYKVIIVGDAFTGKSSLLSRLSDREFERAYAPTIGVDYVRPGSSFSSPPAHFLSED